MHLKKYSWRFLVLAAVVLETACRNAALPPATSAPLSGIAPIRQTVEEDTGPASDIFRDILENAISIDESPPITQVIVHKGERYMDLFAGETRIRRYAIRLGGSPEGAKTRQGDRKTPEGDYQIDWRNPNSRYYKSLHISYPNATDRRQANTRGVDPGGDIMIHGLPNAMNREEYYHYIGERDWTDGCIAVSNAAMDELWILIRNGTPIQIRP
ncbi:MAG: L,D-transpeptidase family protein [Xanthomonadaceae bacterium]|jgi:murein L,D-transpeptidase YafK|nr:L,D-transpeptidase family protein [Xanthomonadaceae bacterium]